MQFQPFPKIPRLKRSVTITEKIDGTNAQVFITKLAGADYKSHAEIVAALVPMGSGIEEKLVMRVGSRNRWITPGKETDNYGFATWALENAEDLFKLGEGQHFGEWYGQGIGRGYGLDHRRFALFNTDRWGDHNPNTPKCCEVVPKLDTHDLSSVDGWVEHLRVKGSTAVPGWATPEGVIVFHHAARSMFKVLLENDHIPKGITQ